VKKIRGKKHKKNNKGSEVVKVGGVGEREGDAGGGEEEGEEDHLRLVSNNIMFLIGV
jgi:hypothetical protein